MTRFSEEFDVDGKTAYDNHNPSIDPRKIKLVGDQILVVRFPTPTEESKGGIIMPIDTKNEKEVFPPNCSRVFAAGPDCKLVNPGDYIFWPQKVDNEVSYLYKPQPLVGFYSKDVPALWTISEMYILAVVPHAGDPVWIDVEDRDSVFVQKTDDEMELMSLHRLGIGDMFSLFDTDEKLKRVMAVRKNGDDVVSVYAVEVR